MFIFHGSLKKILYSVLLEHRFANIFENISFPSSALKPYLRLIFFYIILNFFINPSFAEESKKSILAVETDSMPRIDGVLEEHIWQSMPDNMEMTQIYPKEGAPASFKSSFKVCFDNKNLYVGIKFYDKEPSKITKKLTRRDRDSESDWAILTIDSYNDKKTGKMFSVNASGVQKDMSISEDSRFDPAWDGLWESATKITKDGWQIEIRIPFSTLRYNAQKDATWGFNLVRYVSRLKEKSSWSKLSDNDSKYVSAAGQLLHINTAKTPKRYSITPFHLESVEIDTISDKQNINFNNKSTTGLDLQYGISSDITIDLALNPDFGQVEVDQSVINLTAFETFLSEKRPFFLEGGDIFSMNGTFGSNGALGVRPFYSRRIGGKPLYYGDIAPPSGGKIVYNPAQTPIISAAKITGRTSQGLSIGVLDAVTAPVFAVLEDDNGHQYKEETSPVTNYFAGRIKKDFNDGNILAGGMITSVTRANEAPDSFVAAADFDISSKDKTYSASAMAATSSYLENAEGTTINTTGSTARFFLRKDAGKNIIGEASYGFVDKNFNANDIGRNSWINLHGGYLWADIRNTNRWGPFQSIHNSVLYYSNFAFDTNKLNDMGIIDEVSVEFPNHTFIGVSAGLYPRGYDIFEPRVSGRVYHTPLKSAYSLSMTTDSRKALKLKSFVSAGVDQWGQFTAEATSEATLNIGTRTEVNAKAYGAYTYKDTGYVTHTNDPLTTSGNEEELIIFGNRDISQIGFNANGMFTFTRNLSLQFFSQLLLAKGSYSNFKRLLNSGELSDLGFDYDDNLYGNPNFTSRIFNANIILRWEYKPGATFYAVWTEARDVSDSEINKSLLNNFSETFSRGTIDTFLVKLSYRWGS